MTAIATLIAGALATGYLVAGLFFARFWSRTGERLFAMFAAAFWILALQRVLTVTTASWLEDDTSLYMLRLGAFLLILIAIIDKNRDPSR